MHCGKCNNELRECICSDFKERIESLRKCEALFVDWDLILKQNEEHQEKLVADKAKLN